MESVIFVETTKWPDRPHWRFEVRRLGEDEFGTWVHAPSATAVRRGSEAPFELGSGFVGLIPDDEWWLVEYYPDHPTITIYVNIGTPPIWRGSRVTQIDLDLDVVRRLDGTVEIIDVDEFEEHQVSLGYPGQLVTQAMDAANRAAGLVRRGAEPFDTASKRWLSQVDAGSLRRSPDE